jgi:GNAT superfamily N-acetyltransferase
LGLLRDNSRGFDDVRKTTMDTPSLPNIVYSRDHPIEGGMFATTARMTSALADGVYVDDPDDTWPVLWRTSASERGILNVWVADFVAPEAPPLWFVRVDEVKSNPPAVHLVAFANDARPAGTVLNHYQFATAGVHSDEQAGAVRWYPDGGLVHQVFVASQWRRHQVGTLLLYSAGAVHQSMGWSGRLHSDGRRTPAGDALTSTILHPIRIAPLTETMPSMDAPDA